MNLALSQIKDITTGAVRIEEMDYAIHFYRFTAQQEEDHLWKGIKEKLQK